MDIKIKRYPTLDGIYKHYKGGMYKFLFMAEDDDGEPVVVFKSLLFGSYYTKPLLIWNETIPEVNGEKEVPRFKLVRIDKSR